MTNRPGSSAAARFARPIPSQRPTSSNSSTAHASPSRAASVTTGPTSASTSPRTRSSRPAERVDVPAHAFEQAARDRRARPRQLAGLPAEDVAGGVLLQAAAVAALAAVAVRDDDNVAELARHPVPPALHAAVDDDASADAGSERDHDDVALALCGAEPPLGPRRGVRVVLHDHRQAERDGDGVPKRLVPPGGVRREADLGTSGVDETGGADPDGDDVVGGPQLLDDRDDGRLDEPGVPGGG